MSNGNAAAYFVDRHLQEGPGDKTAFIEGERTLVLCRARRAERPLAALYARHGIAREDRAAMIVLDVLEFPIIFWGSLKAGVVPVPVNTLLRPEQYAYIFADSRAEAIVVSAPLLPALASVLGLAAASAHDRGGGRRGGAGAIPDGRTACSFDDVLARGTPDGRHADTSSDEVAFWLYSSGSTGEPKGVRHIHTSLIATAKLYGQGVLGIRQDDVVLLGRQAVLRLRARQRDVVSDVGRRDRGAARRSGRRRMRSRR